MESNSQLQHNFLILDCTIRDGGYINRWNFSDDSVRDIFVTLAQSGIDIVEIGFRNLPEIYNNGLCGKWRYCAEKDIRNVVPLHIKNKHNTLLAVMADFRNSHINLFPHKNTGKTIIDMVRVAFHKQDIEPALEFCKQLKDKGYIVSANAMATIHYSKEQLKTLCQKAQEFNLDYVYIADSYGSMSPFQLININSVLKSFFINKNAPQIGFHSHNNLQNAFGNAVMALYKNISIIDSTLCGMGRGAGNLCTETIVSFAQTQTPKLTNLLPILKVSEKHILPLFCDKPPSWGFSLPMIASAHHNCHPNYVNKMLDYGIKNISTIWSIIQVIVKSNKHTVFDLEYFNQIIKKPTIQHLLLN